MRIAVVGRGRVGGGLGALWEQAGHEIMSFGRDGGDATGADAALVAVPGAAVAEALDRVRGLEGRTILDATNLVGVAPPAGFASNAEFLKSRVGGPTAKSFNLNFASLHGQLGQARARPGNIWCGDDEARETVELLNRDAGYDPIYAGGLENAAMLEGAISLLFAISGGGLGQFFYRAAPPDRL